MTIGYGENGKTVTKVVTSFDEVSRMLDKLDPQGTPYVHLNRDNDDYVQCAGDFRRLTVEARFYIEGLDKFKHYVIGKQEMSKAWTNIYGPVGPIPRLLHEVLMLEDAREIFSEFYSTGTVPGKYLKRNITKIFTVA
jgi:hypothetical protein